MREILEHKSDKNKLLFGERDYCLNCIFEKGVYFEKRNSPFFRKYINSHETLIFKGAFKDLNKNGDSRCVLTDKIKCVCEREGEGERDLG